MVSIKLMQSVFFKNILVLMTGTVLSQAIPIAIMPILTRIYTPEEFGLLALYVAIFSICSVVATGRYELAIMLPEKDDDARILLQVSIVISIVVSFILFIIFYTLSTEIATYLGNPNIENWLLLVPIAVFFTGCYQSLIYWSNRQKRFKDIALSRVNQSLSVSTIQTGLGFVKFSGGLIIGHVIGYFFALIYLFLKNNNYRKVFEGNKIDEIKEQLIKYKNFPKYSVVGALSDSAALQMPVFILTKYYTVAITGVFSLTFRVLSLPASLVSSALSQVLFRKVVELSQNNPNELSGFILKVFFGLFILFLPVIPFMWYLGEPIFAFVFGEEWRVAGKYAGYLTVAVAVRFCVSPLSSVMALNENVKKGVLWQILYLITISTTLLAATDFGIEAFIKIFVVHEIILYSLYFLIIYNCSKISK